MRPDGQEKNLPVACPDLLNRIQRFTQRLSEPRGTVVFQFLEVFDPLAQLHREQNHQRVEEHDQQGQLPVHPHQDARRAGQGQRGHQQATEGLADELVQRVQVGNQMRGDCAAAQAFVFAQGNPLEALDQAQPDAIDNVLASPANSRACNTLNTSAPTRSTSVSKSIRPM